MCRPNKTHQEHIIIECACGRTCTGEPGDLLLYHCSFRVPFIGIYLLYIYTCIYIYIGIYICIIFCILFLLFFPFLRLSNWIRVAHTRALAGSFSQCPFRNRYCRDTIFANKSEVAIYYIIIINAVYSVPFAWISTCSSGKPHNIYIYLPARVS